MLAYRPFTASKVPHSVAFNLICWGFTVKIFSYPSSSCTLNKTAFSLAASFYCPLGEHMIENLSAYTRQLATGRIPAVKSPKENLTDPGMKIRVQFQFLSCIILHLTARGLARHRTFSVFYLQLNAPRLIPSQPPCF